MMLAWRLLCGGNATSAYGMCVCVCVRVRAGPTLRCTCILGSLYIYISVNTAVCGPERSTYNRVYTSISYILQE